MKTKPFAAIVLALVCTIAGAQDLNSAARLQAMSSSSPEVRMRAADELIGSGITDKPSTDAMAALLKSELPIVNGRGILLDEVDKLFVALASSGDPDYVPIFQEALKHPYSRIQKYARSALKTHAEAQKFGRPILYADKVLLITERQSEQCRLIKQETCEDRGGSIEGCLSEIKETTVDVGGDSIMLLQQSKDGWGMLGVSAVTGNIYRCNK